MSTDAARLVDELTTLLYEPLKGTCLTHTPCVIAACGACRKKADKPESVVHDSDCPVYRLQRAEAANTAVIRANAEEIADLEDVRDDLEARVNALTTENARLTQEVERAVETARWLLSELDAATARAERAEARASVMHETLTLISRGTWTARNSVESMVWSARQALKKVAAPARAGLFDDGRG